MEHFENQCPNRSLMLSNKLSIFPSCIYSPRKIICLSCLFFLFKTSTNTLIIHLDNIFTPYFTEKLKIINQKITFTHNYHGILLVPIYFLSSLFLLMNYLYYHLKLIILLVHQYGNIQHSNRVGSMGPAVCCSSLSQHLPS